MPGKIVNDDLLASFTAYVDFWITFMILCLGLVTNTLNFIVFARQGYKDGVNISMTCIALWDFLKCFFDIVERLHIPIGLISPVFGVSYKNALFTFISYTHIFSGNVSSALATYVSIERCLCVCMPFTVKSVFTPRFTLLMVTAISVIVFGAYFVVYFIWDIIQVYSPEFNTTIAVYVFSEFYYNHGFWIMKYYQTVLILIPFVSFLVLCVCSAVTVHYLKQSSKTLGKLNNSDLTSKDKQGVSQREKQVVKILLVVIGVYIGNLFPRIIFYIAQLIEPEFYVNRLYSNLFKATAMFIFILDDVNAAVNFFIFVKMSSSFRNTFLVIFPSARKCF